MPTCTNTVLRSFKGKGRFLRKKLSNVRLKLEIDIVKAGLKKGLFLSGQYKTHDKLSVVTFRVRSIGS